jgi:hypothetical protein
MTSEPGPCEVPDQRERDGVMSGAATEAGLAETVVSTMRASVGEGSAVADGSVARHSSEVETSALECL